MSWRPQYDLNEGIRWSGCYVSRKSPVLGRLIKASAVVIGAVPACLLVTECSQVKMGAAGLTGD